MSFAVIETGGKQYLVSPGDVITIEKLPGSFAKGDGISFDRVLLMDDGSATAVGTPRLENVKVVGVVEASGKGRKIEVVKYKAKSRYFKLRGHRQPYLRVRIEKIS